MLHELRASGCGEPSPSSGPDRRRDRRRLAPHHPRSGKVRRVCDIVLLHITDERGRQLGCPDSGSEMGRGEHAGGLVHRVSEDLHAVLAGFQAVVRTPRGLSIWRLEEMIPNDGE